MRERLRYSHAQRVVAFQAMPKELLGQLIGVLRLPIQQRQNLHLALLVVLYNLLNTPCQVFERFAMAGQDDTGGQRCNLSQGVQVVTQRIDTIIFRVEANIRRDARQDVIGGQKDAISFAEEADVPI